MELITAQPRDLKASVNRLRKENLVPAVLYGHELKPLHVSVPLNEFDKLFRKVGESVLFTLRIGNQSDDYKVVIHEVAHDPLTGKPQHIDFYKVNLTRPIEAEVELDFVGVSGAVKNEAGILVKNHDTVRVKALPLDMPKKIEVSIEGLKTFEDVIRVTDLKLPKGVTILATGDEAIASVMPPRSEEELKELDKAVEDDVDKVEVEEKGKKEEELVEGEDGAAPVSGAAPGAAATAPAPAKSQDKAKK